MAQQDDRVARESYEQMERHVGAVKEDFDEKI